MKSFLQALPAILALVVELIRLLRDGDKAERAQSVKDMTQALKTLRESSDEAARHHAIRNIAAIINGVQRKP